MDLTFNAAMPPRRRAHGEPMAGAADLYLPPGTPLGGYVVRTVIGNGGMSIVYRAFDEAHRREVAIKEYFPVSLAARAGARVQPLGSNQAELFDLGRRSFLKEAQLLERMNHPALVQVYRVWESNGTAYFAMTYGRGTTLAQHVSTMPGAPTEKWLRKVLRWLLEGLDAVHAAGSLHRDVSPANVMLLDDGSPLLLDFGSARSLAPNGTLPLASFVTPGYSPIEQYEDAGPHALPQGPWTDVYSLAATAYCVITGEAPVPAPVRVMHDHQPRLVDVARDRYHPQLLQALDAALTLQPNDRPRTAADLASLAGLEINRAANSAVFSSTFDLRPQEIGAKSGASLSHRGPGDAHKTSGALPDTRILPIEPPSDEGFAATEMANFDEGFAATEMHEFSSDTNLATEPDFAPTMPAAGDFEAAGALEPDSSPAWNARRPDAWPAPVPVPVPVPVPAPTPAPAPMASYAGPHPEDRALSAVPQANEAHKADKAHVAHVAHQARGAQLGRDVNGQSTRHLQHTPAEADRAELVLPAERPVTPHIATRSKPAPVARLGRKRMLWVVASLAAILLGFATFAALTRPTGSTSPEGAPGGATKPAHAAVETAAGAPIQPAAGPSVQAPPGAPIQDAGAAPEAVPNSSVGPGVDATAPANAPPTPGVDASRAPPHNAAQPGATNEPQVTAPQRRQAAPPPPPPPMR